MKDEIGDAKLILDSCEFHLDVARREIKEYEYDILHLNYVTTEMKSMMEKLIRQNEKLRKEIKKKLDNYER